VLKNLGCVTANQTEKTEVMKTVHWSVGWLLTSPTLRTRYMKRFKTTKKWSWYLVTFQAEDLHHRLDYITWNCKAEERFSAKEV
jgi:hypothetical protein